MRYLVFLAIVAACGALLQLRQPHEKSAALAAAPHHSPSHQARVPDAAAAGSRTTASTFTATAAAPAAQAPLVEEPPLMSQPELEEDGRIRTMFESLAPTLRQCFKTSNMRSKGVLAFRYHFALVGEKWQLGTSSDALELYDSTLPVEADDTATACMREASRGLTLPTEGSIHDGAEAYEIYWSFVLA